MIKYEERKRVTRKCNNTLEKKKNMKKRALKGRQNKNEMNLETGLTGV